jgi:cysteinyl-tRNA synthetase
MKTIEGPLGPIEVEEWEYNLFNNDPEYAIRFLDSASKDTYVSPPDYKERLESAMNYLITDREECRKDRDYKTADSIRNDLKKLGIELQDKK